MSNSEQLMGQENKYGRGVLCPCRLVFCGLFITLTSYHVQKQANGGVEEAGANGIHETAPEQVAQAK